MICPNYEGVTLHRDTAEKPHSDNMSADNHFRIRTYGRRIGKRLRSRQQELLDKVLPSFTIDLDVVAKDPVSLFPQPVKKLWLEIGFGGGEHLLELARRKPEIGFFGCEPFVNGIVNLVSGIVENGLQNVLIHPGDALDLIEKLPDSSIERIYLLYPDPWPKARQQKRRFISSKNLTAMARIISSSGELRFASDIEEYCNWTRELVRSTDEFHDDNRSLNETFLPWESWTVTRYEAKAIREGRSTSYLKFVRSW